MDNKESFTRFKTEVFGLEFMAERIKAGTPSLTLAGLKIDPRFDPNTIYLGLWLARIPEVYRERVDALLKEFDFKKFHGLIINEEMVRAFVYELHTKLVHELTPATMFEWDAATLDAIDNCCKRLDWLWS